MNGIAYNSKVINNRDSILQDARYSTFLKWILVLSFLNLFLVACLGVLLRSFPFFTHFPLSYKNVLHGHSHFAFGGWIMPVLLLLILKLFPEVWNNVAFKHWRNIAYLFFASAYGILVSFPLQGYGTVSLVFSTLSVAASFYLSLVVWKGLSGQKLKASHLFLNWGLVYLCLSATGPFATGPLIVMGYQDEPVYYNAIYFYLHFQYNGWFSFAVLAALYKMIEDTGKPHNGLLIFKLMNAACIPAYALSVLWDQPGIMYNIVGGLAALVQTAAVWYFLKDLSKFEWRFRLAKVLLYMASAAFVLKIALQIFSAFPIIAQLAYEQRNFVIAYLHLVLLGFISVAAFAILVEEGLVTQTKKMLFGLCLFFFSFITTEGLLVINAISNIAEFNFTGYTLLMLICSVPFPAGILLIWYSVQPFDKAYEKPFSLINNKSLQHA